MIRGRERGVRILCFGCAGILLGSSSCEPDVIQGEGARAETGGALGLGVGGSRAVGGAPAVAAAGGMKPVGGSATCAMAGVAGVAGAAARRDAKPGEACCDDGAVVCAGVASSLRLVCARGKWGLGATCNFDENCDGTTPGKLGTCAPILATCHSALVGASTCDGRKVVRCGEDLVASELVLDCQDRPCANGQCAERPLLAPSSPANTGSTISDVALSGDVAALGDPEAGGVGRGAVHVFTRSSGIWSASEALVALDGLPNDLFGHRVAMSADTLVVGAPGDDDSGAGSGSVYVFVRVGSAWVLQQKLLPEANSAGFSFGSDVSIDGNTLIVGAPGDSTFGWGSAYVFARANGFWGTGHKLTPVDTAHTFGGSVDVDGNTVAIGGGDSAFSAETSSVEVFVGAGSIWTRQQAITSAVTFGSDQFGSTVALSGDTLLVAAEWDNAHGYEAGTVFVYNRISNVWNEQAKLSPSDVAEGDRFGNALAVDIDTLIISATGNSLVDRRPYVYVYARAGASWVQGAKVLEAPGLPTYRFGDALTVHNTTALVASDFDGKVAAMVLSPVR